MRNCAVQVWVGRDFRSLFAIGTIHGIPGVSEWAPRICAVSDAERRAGAREPAGITSILTSRRVRPVIGNW
jgi:hypothetical protein